MNQPYRIVRVSSPGKLLISGDYAVLYGASAISVAVNRRACCDLSVKDEGTWKFRSLPPFWDEHVSLAALVSRKSPDVLASSVQWFSRQYTLPEHVAIQMDTSGFFSDGNKLGLGSSAGVLVSLYAAIATCLGHTMSTQDLFEIYRASRNNGSGVDVLTSYYGGIIKFEQQTAQSVELPKGLYFDFYAVGYSTNTTTMVERFRQKFDKLPVSLQQRFISTACKVSASISNATNFFYALEQFIEVYRELATESKMSIWSELHESMFELASKVGALYKPSGAGDGDIGVAVSTDPQCLAQLRRSASNLPVTSLDLQRDSNGVRVEEKT